jgi:hypothetical protein
VAVRGDGQLALHPHVPEQETRGFSRSSMPPARSCRSVVIPTRTATATNCGRWSSATTVTRASSSRRRPGKKAKPSSPTPFYVDSGATYSGAPTTTVSGLDHLANRRPPSWRTAPWSPVGASTGRQSDAGAHRGRVDDPRRPAVTRRGSSGFARGRDANGGTIQGKRKRLVSILLRLLDTVGIKVDPGTGKADQLIDRPGSAPMDTPVPPFTGDTTAKSLSGNWDRDGQGTIISDDPLPCMVLAAMPKIEIGT